uniref:Ig-like domain-containing protein n=1 Tax=Gouania willdenowi TaxID=441366 RepID=A0A8C5G0I4_GOUWI
MAPGPPVSTFVLLYLVVSFLEPEVIGSPDPIFCSPGADVVLPCHLDPELDVRDLTVEWSRTDRSTRPQYVHIYRNRREVSTISRTRLFVEQLGHGNISLKVLNVSAEDGGAYRCFIPKLRSRTLSHLLTNQHLLIIKIHPSNCQIQKNCFEPGVTARSRVTVVVVSLLVVFAVVGLFVAFCVFKSRPENKGDGHAHNRPLKLTLRDTLQLTLRDTLQLTLQPIDEQHQCGQFRDQPAGGAVL